MAVPKKVDWSKADNDVVREGTKIILPNDPEPMPLRVARDLIDRKIADEETIINTMEVIDAYPMDGAVAFNKAMKQKYGWASPIPTPTFFGPKPPELRTVKTGPGPKDEVQVPWGRFILPGVEHPVNTGSTVDPKGQPVFVIHGQVRKRDQVVIKELAKLTREILKEESIYRGKRIRLQVNHDGMGNYTLDHEKGPEFMEVSSLTAQSLILNTDERDQIETALWTPVQNADACRKHKIPLKRGILLSGVYGTGKTLTATVTAQICEANGWTFVLLDKVEALQQALLFARRYSPAVIFAEDVDRVAAIRDGKGNDLLNTIDGALTKDAEIIVVLTTNFVERLDKAMLRPGRLDAVINMRPPEGDAVKALIRLYARELLSPSAELDEVATVLAGNIPATIREVVERSKLGMIHRNSDEITAEDLLVAAQGMKHHLDLLVERKPEHTDGELLANLLRRVVVPEPLQQDGATVLRKEIREIKEKVNNF